MSEGERLLSDVSVVEHKGNVLIGDPNGKPIFGLDPEAARGLSEALARCSYKARFGVEPATGKGQSAVSQELRKQMVNRAMHIDRSLTDKQKPRILVMEAIVDAVLSKAGV